MSFTNVAIRTGNLFLREFTPNDFESFLAATCHPEYQQYYPEQETSRPLMVPILRKLLLDPLKKSQNRHPGCTPTSPTYRQHPW